jgi:hypothetical protein
VADSNWKSFDAAVRDAPDPEAAKGRLLDEMEHGKRRYRYRRSDILEWYYSDDGPLPADWFFLARNSIPAFDAWSLGDQFIFLLQVEILATEAVPEPETIREPAEPELPAWELMDVYGAIPEPERAASEPASDVEPLKGYQARRVVRAAKEIWQQPDGTIPDDVPTMEAERLILANLDPESRRLRTAQPSHDVLMRVIPRLRRK